MSRLAKQLLYILDYEDYLKHGVEMPTEAKRWVKVHEWQLDTAKKRVNKKATTMVTEIYS